MIETLNFIQQELNNASIPYEFERWTAPVTYPYFVGETSTVEPMNEDGQEEMTVILTGWNRPNLYPLYLMAEKVRRIFPPIGGKTAILEIIDYCFCGGKDTVTISQGLRFSIPMLSRLIQGKKI